MPEYDMSIHTNPDAVAWVKFVRECNPDCNVPDDILLTWFSNAMMAMHDHLTGQHPVVFPDASAFFISNVGQTMPEGKSEYPADILAAAERATHECYDPKTQVWYDVKDIIAKYLLAERQRHAASATVRGMHSIDAAAFRQLVEDGKAFADTDPEAQFIADAEHACPHCGGSGHKDDIRQSPSTEENLQHD